MNKRLLVFLSALLAAGPSMARMPGGVPNYAVSHKKHSSPPCDWFLSLCKAKSPDKAEGCQVLFQEAEASGGYWGLPEARIKAHLTHSHREAFCTA